MVLVVLVTLQGTQLRHSTSYHPQIDGQFEVVNKCLETYLCCFCNDTPKQWSQWIPWAEFWYNMTYHVSIATTPFHIVYGRAPPTLIGYGSQKTTNATLDQQLADRDLMVARLKEPLQQAQDRMKKYVDLKRRDVEFQEGDHVYLKIRPYRQKSMAK